MGRKAGMTLERHQKGGPAPQLSRRRRRRRIVVAIMALLVLGGGLGAWLWNGARATPVEPAPRFNLFASTGRVITLDDYLGKQEVVLVFFMGTS